MGQTSGYGRRRSLTTKAFTLVEVFVALSIMAIALVVLLRLQIVSITMLDRAERLSRAMLLANAKMAEVLSTRYPEIGTRGGSIEEEDSDIILHWQTTVSDVRLKELEDAAVSGLRSVYVRVTWDEGRQQKLVQMVTYVGDKR